MTGTLIPCKDVGFVDASMFVDRQIQQVSSKHHHFYHKMFVERGFKRSWQIQRSYFRSDGMHLTGEGYSKIEDMMEWVIRAVHVQDFFSVLSVHMREEEMQNVYWKF